MIIRDEFRQVIRCTECGHTIDQRLLQFYPEPYMRSHLLCSHMRKEVMMGYNPRPPTKPPAPPNRHLPKENQVSRMLSAMDNYSKKNKSKETIVSKRKLYFLKSLPTSKAINFFEKILKLCYNGLRIIWKLFWRWLHE